MIENRNFRFGYDDTNRTELYGLKEEPVLEVYRVIKSGERVFIGEFTKSICGNLSKMEQLLRHQNPESLEFSINWNLFFQGETS